MTTRIERQWQNETDEAYFAMKRLEEEFNATLKDFARRYDELMICGGQPKANDYLWDLEAAAEGWFAHAIDTIYPRISEDAKHA